MTKAKQIVELLKLIESLQWASCDGCGQHNFCPICGASALNYEYGPGDHKDSCPVGDALKGTKVSE